MSRTMLEETKLIRDLKLVRGELAPHERKFCERIIKFIKYILPIEFPAQCERAQGLIFGTQTLTSVIDGKKGYNLLVRDNFLVIVEICNYVSKAKMVVGNLKDNVKALHKVELWKNEFSIKPKLRKVTAGPVSPEALKNTVDKHFKKNSAGLLVVMMDSGGHKDYIPIAKALTERYVNLYILKMILKGQYAFKILRAYQGNISIVNNDKFEKLYRLAKKKGWEHYRRNSQEILNELFEEMSLKKENKNGNERDNRKMERRTEECQNSRRENQVQRVGQPGQGCITDSEEIDYRGVLLV